MKKLLSLVLSFAMVLCYNITAFATGTGSITITNPSSSGMSIVGHTFNAYKIFDAKFEEGNSGYAVAEKFAPFFTAKAGEEDPAKDVSTPAKLNAFAIEYVNEADLTELARELTAFATFGPDETKTAHDETVVIEVSELGYYLVVDASAPEGAVAAASLSNTNKDAKVTLKGSQPEVDKEILHNENGTWGPVGDNAIGDEVFYRLLAKLPQDITGYTKYTYILGDTMDDSLTFNNNIEVKYDGTVIPEEYYAVTSPGTRVDKDGNPIKTTFDLSIDVIKLYEDEVVPQGSVLTVEYSAILNENAVMAPESNDNKVDLEYSNDPYDSESTDKTPEVVVKDYTFEVDVLKTAETTDGEALAGVEFELSNKDGLVSFTETTLEDGTNVYTVAKEGTTTIVTGTNGKFKIVGLDDAVEYTLKETKALDGYNTIEDIVFTITATYNEDGTVKELTTNNASFGLSSTIVNTSGALLPETGGIGTTIFTVAGGALMIGSVAVMISKRRSSK